MAPVTSRGRFPSEEGLSANSQSPISHLFATNDAPSEDELAMLLEELGALRLDAQNLHSPSELHQLGERITRLHRALSPVRLVPQDLLDEIFTRVNAEDLDNTTLVCRSWYSASITASQKHDEDLEIEFDPMDGLPYERIHSWLAKCRYATGKKSLKIAPRPRVSCGYKGITTKCHWVDSKFFSLLADLSLSPVRLDLRIALCCLQNVLENNSWLSLHSLTLHIRSIQWQDEEGASAMYKSIFHNLPRALKTLTLVTSPYRGSAYSFNIPARLPYGSLTNLALDCHWNEPVDISAILRQCSSLQTLLLNLAYHTSEEYDRWKQAQSTNRSEQAIVLHGLHTLTLQNLMPYMVSMALHQLKLPALTYFTLEYKFRPPFRLSNKYSLREIIDGLRLLSPYHESSIRSLTVHRMETNAASLADVFFGLPHLERLVMERVEFTAQELLSIECPRSQTSTNNPEPIFPSLRNLELRGLSNEFQTAAFLQYVERRSMRYRKLKDNSEAFEVGSSGMGDNLRWIIIQYESWCGESKENWRNCAAIVRSLRSDFGIAVERIVSEDEWAEYGKAGFGASQSDSFLTVMSKPEGTSSERS